MNLRRNFGRGVIVHAASQACERDTAKLPRGK
jgi:hypothetical protein